MSVLDWFLIVMALTCFGVAVVLAYGLCKILDGIWPR